MWSDQAALAASLPPHPNDVDRKRIERALSSRRRYLYVKPSVLLVPCGYHIQSPCCSRNVDADGGVIDVALVTFHSGPHPWHLHRKVHGQGVWEFHSRHRRLIDILEVVNVDADRQFWQ